MNGCNSEIKNIRNQIKILHAEKRAIKRRINTDELERTEEDLIRLSKEQKRLMKQEGEEPYSMIRSKSFRDADSVAISLATGVDCKLRIWRALEAQKDPQVFPSSAFKEAYVSATKAFHMATEAGRRIILNLFLSEVVVLPEFQNHLRIFPEMSAKPQWLKLKGRSNYTIGFANGIDTLEKASPHETHLIAVEAKKEMDDDDLWQCVAETAELFKSRKDTGKTKCSVFGVLSNAMDWRVITIDQDGRLWLSETLSLNLRTPKDDEINNIYRVIYYIVRCCYESRTPPASPRAWDTRC